MNEDHSKMLAMTIQKLNTRGARQNIKNILAKTHPADIAELLGRLQPEDRYDVFLFIEDEEIQSHVLSLLEEDEQKEMVSILSKKDVLRLVSQMEKDDAADLLGHIPEEDAGEILSSMVKEDSQEVAGLMGYPEDSAGGLMSSDYLALMQTLSVAEVIERIQTEGDEGSILFYVYVVNENNQLVGVSSLKQLLLSKRKEKLSDIMFTDVISVDVATDQEEVAKTVEKYDFLSLPVISGNNELVGVITVDDVIDVIREEAEEDLLAMGRAGWGLNVSTKEHFMARIPWLLFSYFAGAICFAIVYYFEEILQGADQIQTLWLVVAFVPLLLSMGATTGSQSATIAVGNLRGGGFEWEKVKKQLRKEALLSLLFAMCFGLLTVIIAFFLTPISDMATFFGATLSAQIIISMALGAFIPIGIFRFGVDPTVASVPLFTAFADVTAMALLFSILSSWS